MDTYFPFEPKSIETFAPRGGTFSLVSKPRHQLNLYHDVCSFLNGSPGVNLCVEALHYIRGAGIYGREKRASPCVLQPLL